jgi:hypothetical protein
MNLVACSRGVQAETPVESDLELCTSFPQSKTPTAREDLGTERSHLEAFLKLLVLCEPVTGERSKGDMHDTTPRIPPA